MGSICEEDCEDAGFETTLVKVEHVINTSRPYRHHTRDTNTRENSGTEQSGEGRGFGRANGSSDGKQLAE
jgi:hypothetical protein